MTIAINDTFTEASTLALTLHTPDVGTAWTEVFNNTSPQILFIVDGATDECTPAGGQTTVGVALTASPALSTADCDVEITLVAIHTTSGTRPFHIYARYADINNWYRLSFYRPDIGSPVEIGKCVSGSHSTLVQYTGTGIAAGDRWKFELRGTTLKAYRDSGAGYSEILSTTDSDLSSAGNVGIGAGNVNGSGGHLNSAWRVDDFTATEVGGGGGSPGSFQAAWAIHSNQVIQ